VTALDDRRSSAPVLSFHLLFRECGRVPPIRAHVFAHVLEGVRRRGVWSGRVSVLERSWWRSWRVNTSCRSELIIKTVVDRMLEDSGRVRRFRGPSRSTRPSSWPPPARTSSRRSFPAGKKVVVDRELIRSFAEKATPHAALIPQSVPGASGNAGNPRNARVRKPCSRPKSPRTRAQPGRAMTGLSRRRSRGSSPVAPVLQSACKVAPCCCLFGRRSVARLQLLHGTWDYGRWQPASRVACARLALAIPEGGPRETRSRARPDFACYSDHRLLGRPGKLSCGR
jgi:hypothetical protein